MSTTLVAVATTTGIFFTQPEGLAHPDAGRHAGSSSIAVANAAFGAGGGSGTVLSGARGKGSSLAATRPRVAAPAPVTPTTVPSAPAVASLTAVPSVPVPPVPSAAPPLPAPPSSQVLSYQFQLQVNGYFCGPAATRIALTARGKSPTQDAIASTLGTTVGGTNSSDDTTRALNALLSEIAYHTHLIPGNAATAAETEQFRADVVRAVNNGYVVVANIIGTAIDVAGGRHGYATGHYVAVVGYSDDGRAVKVADPADTSGDGTYWMATATFANWMAHRGYSA